MTQKELKKILKYNRQTGIFTWKISTSKKIKVGSEAGADKEGYRVVHIYGKRYRLHRLAWLYVHGYMPTDVIDHKNRIKSDNRIDNLREVTQQENCKNCNMSKNNTSGVTGVTWDKQHKKWRVQIMVEGKNKYIGLFRRKDEAMKARREANEKYNFHKKHGE